MGQMGYSGTLRGNAPSLGRPANLLTSKKNFHRFGTIPASLRRALSKFYKKLQVKEIFSRLGETDDSGTESLQRDDKNRRSARRRSSQRRAGPAIKVAILRYFAYVDGGYRAAQNLRCGAMSQFRERCRKSHAEQSRRRITPPSINRLGMSDRHCVLPRAAAGGA